jgi:hypothetical protein
MKFTLHTLLLAALIPMSAAPAFAGSAGNVYLSGQVLKGDDQLAGFSAPLRMGGALPLKGEISNGAGKLFSEVRGSVTPISVAGTNVVVQVTAELTEYKHPARFKGERKELVSDTPESESWTISRSVEIAQGEPTVIPFGNCTTPTSCSHSIVLSASAQ